MKKNKMEESKKRKKERKNYSSSTFGWNILFTNPIEGDL